VIYAGGGVVNAEASAELREFAMSDCFPVTCTLMGLGAFPAPHPQWLGMLGMHGTRAANYAMDEADLIVAIGARFDDRITGQLSEFAPNAKFVHIDIDPAEIGKNVPAHIPIVGDAKQVVGKLITEYRAIDDRDNARLDDWWAKIDGWREKRVGGGIVIDVQQNEIVAHGLSMPHSPRLHDGKLVQAVILAPRGEPAGGVDTGLPCVSQSRPRLR